MQNKILIAAVIPAYKVTRHVLGVIEDIGPEFTHIYVVDDKCPDGSGKFVEKKCKDKRVKVLYNAVNKGVGGAVITGYEQALADNVDIAVKIDGDGQMDPKIAGRFIAPIVAGKADYTKGNRFHSFYAVRQMPLARLFGNAVLSFMTKLSSGYWHLFDPTNGYTAIHKSALGKLELSKLSQRYIFETDMLLMLSDLRAVVRDVTMEAKYADEVSHLKIHKVTGQFFLRHIKATFRRIFYAYFLRDFNLASINLMVGFPLFLFGVVFGILKWSESVSSGMTAPVGTVMLSALPILLGFQLILFFLGYDISNDPKTPLQETEKEVDLLSARAGKE